MKVTERVRIPSANPTFLSDAAAEQSGRRLQPVPRRCNSCRRLQSSRVDPIRWGLSLKVEHLSYKEATGEHYLQPLPRDIGPKARCQPATLANPGRYRDVAPVFNFYHAFVAQWIRAPGFEPGGCGFESLRKCHFILKRPRSPTAEAPGSDPGGWGCNSLRGYQFQNSSVAETEMHSSRKGDHVGATPTGGTTFQEFSTGQASRRRLLSDRSRDSGMGSMSPGFRHFPRSPSSMQ